MAAGSAVTKARAVRLTSRVSGVLPLYRRILSAVCCKVKNTTGIKAYCVQEGGKQYVQQRVWITMIMALSPFHSIVMKAFVHHMFSPTNSAAQTAQYSSTAHSASKQTLPLGS